MLKQAILREVEWCANVPDYQEVMSRSIYGSKTPLQRSLSKLEAEREVQTWAAKYAVDDEEEDDGTDGRLTLVERVVEECTIEDGGCFDPDRPDFVEEGLSTDGGRTIASLADVGGMGGDNEVIANIFDANGPCVQAMPAGQVVPGIGPVPVLKKSSLIVMIRHGKTENNKLGLFTGWDDVPLATDGVEEAKAAGKLLKRHGFEFDVIYTSWLSRAIETAWYVMDEMDCLWLPIIKSWRLNESE